MANKIRRPCVPVQRLAGIACGSLFLSACAGPFSTLDPAGPSAANIALLWWIMFAGSAVIFAGVMLLFTLAIWKQSLMPDLAARQWIIHGGLVFPSIVLLLLLLASLILGERLIAKPLAEPPLRVTVDARMWAWSFSYPDSGQTGETAVLHIPAGQPVDMLLNSRDVIHSFWVPRLAGKIDAVPGHQNVVRIEADRPGIYRGACAEFCGAGHAFMHFTVEAHEVADYEAALRQALAEGAGNE